MNINTALVAHEACEYPGGWPYVLVHILDGHDVHHRVEIDRPAAAHALIAAAQAYLALKGE